MSKYSVFKSELAKITPYSKYRYPNYSVMPIDILRNQRLFGCKSTSDFCKWFKQTPAIWSSNIKKVLNKKLSNKNIIVAGFFARSSIDVSTLNESNLPSFEEAENIFFVENSDGFVEDIINKLKAIPNKNPTVHIIDIGITHSKLPT